MSLTIKDEEIHRLVRELAQLTGESQTTAVAVSVRERLDRLHAAGRPSLADRLVAIGKNTAPRLKKPHRTPLRATRQVPWRVRLQTACKRREPQRAAPGSSG